MAPSNQWRALVRGRLHDLPKENSNIIRIFLSSTFADFEAERNILFEKAYPELRTFCDRLGLEFEVVDMRWGVKDIATADHSTSSLCINEIRKCQKLSVGPNFVCFLGNRYGYRSIQPVISKTEFNIFQIVAKKQKIATSRLDEWYKIDTNAKPVVYVLQPITAKFKNYFNVDPAQEEAMMADRRNWVKVATGLKTLLKKLSQIAVEDGLLQEADKHKYFISVTEAEIEEGILNYKHNESHCFCFIRNLTNISDASSNENMKHLVDIEENNELDTEGQQLLGNLKNSRIPGKLRKANIKSYTLEASESGIDPSLASHAVYLEKFCENFIQDIKTLTQRSLNAKNQKPSDQQQEVLHHAHFCLSKVKMFYGRADLIGQIFGKLVNPDNQRPLVIHGTSGCGKTSLMSMVASDATEWLGSNVVVVYRFLGTSSQSSSIHQVLKSMTLQICEAYDMRPPGGLVLDTYNNASTNFPKLLRAVSATRTPLLLIFDSLDQLSPMDGAHKLNWLPKFCPPHVKIAVSTLPEEHGILPTLRRALPDDEGYVAVPSLAESTASDILNMWMGMVGRKVTTQQRKVIIGTFSRCKQPLFLKLVFDEACRWNSYTPISEVKLGNKIKEAISLLYERLETQHGKTLVSHALGYITAAKNGLSAMELEDVLSLDDEVLDEVYQYWSPPNKGMIHIPPLIWARLRYDIDDYLVDRQADGKTVMALYHRQFIETAKDRYLKGEDRVNRHSLLADYFLGTWSEGKIKKLFLSYTQEKYEADRNVQRQPLLFDSRTYNFRRLSELSFHLWMSGRCEELVHHCFGSLAWIRTKTEATSVQETITDFNTVLEMEPNKDYQMIRDCLRLSKPTIEFERIFKSGMSNDIACELLGRLECFESRYPNCVGHLLAECRLYCATTAATLLEPTYACYPAPGGSLRSTLIGHSGGITALDVTDDQSLLVTAAKDNTVRVWEIETDEPVQILDKHTGPILSAIATQDKKLIISTSTDNTLRVWNVVSGECLYTLPENHCHNTDVVCKQHLTVSHDNKLIFSVSDNVLNVWDLGSGEMFAKLQGHLDNITCSAVTSKSKTVVTCGRDKLVIIWRKVDSDYCVSQRIQFDMVVLGVKISFDNKHAVLTSPTSGAAILDLTAAEAPPILEESAADGAHSACFTRNNEQVVIGCSALVKVYDRRTGTLYRTLEGHDNIVSCVSTTSDNAFIVSASHDESLMVWSMKTGEPLQILEGLPNRITSMDIAGDLAVAASDEAPFIKLWKIEGKASDNQQRHYFTRANLEVVLLDGEHVVREFHNTLRVWNRTANDDINTFTAHKSQITCLVGSRSDRFLATGSHDGDIVLWDVSTWNAIWNEEQDGTVTALAFSNDETLLLSCLDRTSVTCWNLETKTAVHRHDLSSALKTEVTAVAMATNNRLVCGHNNGVVRIIDVATADKVALFKPTMKSVKVLKLSDDNSLLAVAMETVYVVVYDMVRNKMLHKIECCASAVNDVDFSRGGQYFAVASEERILKIWDSISGQRVNHAYVYSAVLSVRFAVDGIIAGTKIGHLLVLRNHLCNILDLGRGPSRLSDKKSSTCAII